MQRIFLCLVIAWFAVLGSMGAMPVAAQTKVDPSAPAPVYATVITAAGKRLPVRSGPGVNYPILARLANGQRVQALGRNAGGQWLLIALPGAGGSTGWVSKSYVSLSAPIASLPVASAPAAAPVVPAPKAVAPASGEPAPGNLPGKIALPVFNSDTGQYSVWMVDANGSNLHLVVANASAPALSYDGQQLAYRHWQRDDRGLVVANSQGANPVRLTDKLEDTLPSFSPDGKKIAFSSYRDGDRRNRLYYVWADEQNLRAWEWGPGGLFGEDPYWMADTQIIYRTTWPDDQLWAMNSDSSGQHRFYSASSIYAPAASPDSRTIAYMGASNGNWDIYSVGIAGDDVRRLTKDTARDGLPAWSPDGQSIAFVSEREGQWGLWVMNADGTNQRLLVTLPGTVDGKVRDELAYLTNGWLEEQVAWSW
jgi:TolB protein